jgi:hypothetical protein
MKKSLYVLNDNKTIKPFPFRLSTLTKAEKAF